MIDRTGVAPASLGNAGWLVPGLAIPLKVPFVLRYGRRSLLNPDRTAAHSAAGRFWPLDTPDTVRRELAAGVMARAVWPTCSSTTSPSKASACSPPTVCTPPADKMAEAGHPFKHVELDAGQLREHVPMK